MTTVSLPLTYEARLKALEDQMKMARNGTIGGGSYGVIDVRSLQFTPGGLPVLPGGTIVGPGGFQTGIPAAPTGLSLSTGADDDGIFIQANWSAPVYTADAIVSWGILVVKSGDAVPSYYNPPAGQAPPYKIRNLLPNTTYSVTVWGITALGAASNNLGPQSITTGIDSTVPSVITGLTGGVGYQTITVTWNALGGTPPNNWKGSYEAQISTDSTFATGTITQNTGQANVTTFGSLTIGTPYYIRVRAISTSLVPGPYSSTLGPLTPGRAEAQPSDGNAPTGSMAQPSVTGMIGAVFVNWTKISNPDLVTYEVHLSTSSSFSPTSLTKVGEVQEGTSFTVKTLPGSTTPLAYNTDYYIIIYAKDNDGYTTAGPSPISNAVQALQVINIDVATGTITANKLVTGTITASSAIISSIDANVITTGTLDASIAHVTNIDASNISTGTIGAGIAYLGNVAATQITSGSLSSGVILTSNLSAGQITTGSMAADRIGAGTISASLISIASGGIIQSSNFNNTPGSEAGWRIDSAGNAYLNNGFFRGTIFGATLGSNDFSFLNSSPNGIALRIHYDGTKSWLQPGASTVSGAGIYWNHSTNQLFMPGGGSPIGFIDGIAADPNVETVPLFVKSTVNGQVDHTGGFGTMGLRASDTNSTHPGVAFNDISGSRAALFAFWGPGNWLEAKNFDNSSFIPIRADSFPTSPSNMAFKKNVEEFSDSSLAKLRTLKHFRYDLEKRHTDIHGNPLTELGNRNTNKRQLGWSAEEVHEAFPEVVAYDETQSGIVPSGIDYGRMVVPVSAAVLELDERLSKLEKVINDKQDK